MARTHGRRTDLSATGRPRELDADAILAAQASLLGGPWDVVTLATTNVGHLSRFPRLVAEEWERVVP